MNVLKHSDSPWQEWRPGVKTRVWTGAINGAMSLSGGEQFFEPGAGAPRHWHYYEEHVTIFSGKAEVWVDGETGEVEGPATLLLHPLQHHAFTNIGDTPLHVIGFHTYPISHTMMEDDPDGTATLSWEVESEYRQRRLTESGTPL